MRGFGSDNHAGAHPDVLPAMVAANVDHAHAYGDDPWTARAIDVLRGQLARSATSRSCSTAPARTASRSPRCAGRGRA